MRTYHPTPLRPPSDPLAVEGRYVSLPSSSEGQLDPEDMWNVISTKEICTPDRRCGSYDREDGPLAGIYLDEVISVNNHPTPRLSTYPPGRDYCKWGKHPRL